ncbi:sucrose phosphorylase [Microlunatus panaciterrae]|uniref:Sucrose phosphorylase n=1 Tax=Microlunatus panaciterrae TaxID=400768 RepID=A0ABS2RFV0_9ACTN|nr:sucrose phosphorylase [Microlunatus panaciterrae]MBM7797568.1 sucrose phosphorylase [Microlunatus panaciterrae]
MDAQGGSVVGAAVEPRSGHGVELLTYADRLGGDLARLGDLLAGPLSDFDGVHILPFFVPYDGADAGFDPVDHAQVDPRLGDWDQVRALAKGCEVTADLIVNHVSSESAEFRDWLRLSDASPYDGMFLTYATVFPDGGTEQQITAFYRPRPGLPFTAYSHADGQRRLVWTTFLPSQVDLDVHHPRAKDYLRRILTVLRTGGVTTVRLDAVGYAVKTPGTDSFMTAQTLDFVSEITALAREIGLRVLVEVHANYRQQLAIAPLVDLVYDFALPALLLHGFGTHTVDRLAHWLDIRPSNAITVLDTHDGIGVIDAGPGGGQPGLLSLEEMTAIFARAETATNGHSAIASVVPEWAAMPHQINATFFSALGADLTTYLVARAVQLWMPGRPQLYYVGLLGGLDDVELFARTGNGRDVNRHVYDADETADALRSDVTRALLALVRLRSNHRAFDGTFSHRVLGEDRIELTWTGAEASARLEAGFAAQPDLVIELTDAAGSGVVTEPGQLLEL